jgi:hypothetical protein
MRWSPALVLAVIGGGLIWFWLIRLALNSFFGIGG